MVRTTSSRDVFAPYCGADRVVPALDESFVVPERIWKAVDLSGRDKNVILRSLSFDLDEACFVKCEVQEVRTLLSAYCAHIGEQIGERFLVLKLCVDVQSDAPAVSVIDGSVEKLLRDGIVGGDGENYNLVGCSNSQVQNRSFYFRRGDKQECRSFIRQHFLPFIEAKRPVAKRVKYAGLLFTACQHIVDLPTDLRVGSTNDRTDRRGQFNFTDGCGLISWKLAKHLAVTIGWKDVPSIIQIR